MDATEKKVLIIKLLVLTIILGLIAAICLVIQHLTAELITPSVPTQEHPAFQTPTAFPINWPVSFKVVGIGILFISFFLAILNYIKVKLNKAKEEREEQEELLQEYLSSTHKTFAEQELEELKQKYDEISVSVEESLPANDNKSQVIALDIRIENGKITSITEVEPKTESDVQKSRLTANEVLNKAFKSMYM